MTRGIDRTVHLSTQLMRGSAFVVAYVALDWASYLHPMYGLNITPWNPSLALGMAYWLRAGWRALLPWFSAILVGEILVRGLPASLPLTLLLAATLTLCYGLVAETLRRYAANEVLHDRRRLLSWLAIVLVGTLLTSGVFVSLIAWLELIPVADRAVAFVRFWVGDCVGILVTMPFFLLLLDGRERLLELTRNWEMAGYGTLAALALWIAFGLGGAGEFQSFSLLFLPIVWAAARHGMPGAAVAAFFLQAGIIVAVQWQNLVAVTVFELQTLGAMLACVGFFIGTVVDEKQRVSDELRQTLRLAAAGEMAAALAHELNQPLTALSTYGSACQKLLELGGDTAQLRAAVGRMVSESHRAAEVVRRLRDFFRTGATHLEPIDLADLVASVADQFSARAEQASIELVTEVSADVRILADQLQLEVVLRNLLDNACDAVAEQPPGQRRILLRGQRKGRGDFCLRVEDSGRGIAAARAADLFRAFHSTKSSGLGLGLAISRAIAEAHGGSLIAEPADGGVFVLTLPLEPTPDEHA